MKAKTRNICVCSFMSLCIVAIVQGQTPKDPVNVNWSDYGGGLDSVSCALLQQINKGNVDQLTQAWFFPVPGTSARFSFSPLIVDGKMYVLGKGDEIISLDAVTGKQVWSHPTQGTPTDRGINYWESKDRSDRRLIFSADSYLQEINARTGVTVPSFGKDGRVDLRQGLGRDPKSIRNIQTGTPGRVFENLIILGSAPGEGYG